MGKNKSNNKIIQPSEAPNTLEDSLFFGLRLDEDQKKFRDAIYDKEKLIVLCNSKAGTGKTTIAVGVAYIMVQYGLYNGIVYIASPTMEQKQGYLPGDIEYKNAPYREPLIEACYSLDINPYTSIISSDNIDNVKNGSAFIEFTTDTYLRGTNFQNKVIIIDEAQNFYFDELKKTLTRIHDNCKVIVIGHDKQCDLYKNKERSGFVPYLKAFKESDDPRVCVCELTTNHRGWVSTFCDNVEI